VLPVRTCTAVCWREGSSWVVHLPELDRSATASRLSQVEGVARDLLRVHTSEDPASCRIVVDLRVHQSTTELIAAAADLRADTDRVSVEAVTLRRGVARRLAAEGFEVRDVAALLGLSYGRTLSLLNETAPVRRPASAPVLDWAPAPRPPAGGAPVRPHTTYRHEAFLYRGEDEFLESTAAFLHEAVALDQPVVVAVVPAKLAPLRVAVGQDAPVHWVDMAEVGANPGRVLPALREFVDEHAGRPVRALGEPVWTGRRPEEVVECQVHEALLNVAVEPDVPLWLRCAYDAKALEDDVLLEVSRSHPALVDDGDYRGSLHYGGVDHVQETVAAQLPAPEGPVEELSFDRGSLAGVRSTVLAAACAAGLGDDRSADLALAVGEAAANSVRHGGGRGALRVWESPGALVCEVRDAGRIEDPLAGRRLPPLDAESGRGLWLLHQLGDLVQVRSGDDGTAVRVHAWL
jgi:anti-sigma regulatory factor (Ser/Thr protein kinase)